MAKLSVYMWFWKYSIQRITQKALFGKLGIYESASTCAVELVESRLMLKILGFCVGSYCNWWSWIGTWCRIPQRCTWWWACQRRCNCDEPTWIRGTQWLRDNPYWGCWQLGHKSQLRDFYCRRKCFEWTIFITLNNYLWFYYWIFWFFTKSAMHIKHFSVFGLYDW